MLRFIEKRLRSSANVAGCAVIAGCLQVVSAVADVGTRSAAPIRGIIRPISQASISIDLPMRVQKLHFREAEAFRKGDRLVSFDCKRSKAEYAAAIAVSREAKMTLQSQSYLDQRGAVGKLDVEIARARADKAAAEADAIGARIEQCTLLAPFDGRITELKTNEHEIPPVGQPFMSIVDESNFEVDLVLPSTALRVLEKGTPFEFRVDETGIVYQAQILRIGAAIDPVSQTVKAIGQISHSDSRVVAGMSGTAVLPGLEPSR